MAQPGLIYIAGGARGGGGVEHARSQVAQGALSNRYRLEARIAKGGMGVVHRAYDEVLGRPVAVKVLAGDLAENPEFIERFRREARNAAMLLHPNIAGVFDYGHDHDRWYIVMELVEGEDLAARLKRFGRLGWAEAFSLGEHVAAALIHAHARGLVHRDVKPGNILICEDGTAKVTDFGIALAAQATTTLTQTGTALGTPNYMAPEQAKGEPVGPAADLYSVGVVLFECITGERPYQADSGIALAMQHVTAPVPDPGERGVALPNRVVDLVMRCMAKGPSERYPSAAALREALRSCQAEPAAARAGAGPAPAGAAAPWAASAPTAPFRLADGAPGGEGGPAPAWRRPSTPEERLDAAPTPVRLDQATAAAGEEADRRRGGAGVGRTAAMIAAAVALVVAAFLIGRATGGGGGGGPGQGIDAHGPPPPRLAGAGGRGGPCGACEAGLALGGQASGW